MTGNPTSDSSTGEAESTESDSNTDLTLEDPAQTTLTGSILASTDEDEEESPNNGVGSETDTEVSDASEPTESDSNSTETASDPQGENAAVEHQPSSPQDPSESVMEEAERPGPPEDFGLVDLPRMCARGLLDISHAVVGTVTDTSGRDVIDGVRFTVSELTPEPEADPIEKWIAAFVYGVLGLCVFLPAFFLFT